MVEQAHARRATGGVAIAPSVLREPYGHCGGVISLGVRSADGGDGDARPVRAPVGRRRLVGTPCRLRGRGRSPLFERWQGRVRALVLPETLDGPVLVAAGRADAWHYHNATEIPWRVLRTVSVAASRHLEAAGWTGARVVKPKTFTLPGRVYQATNAVLLRAVERRSVDWADAVAVKRRLVETATRWVDRLEGPTFLSLGQFPVSFPSGVPGELAEMMVDLDVHADLASGSTKDEVTFARLGWRKFDLARGGRAVDRAARLAHGERLAAVLGQQGDALSYGCVSFDDRLCPLDDPAGAVRSWSSDTNQWRDAAGTFVLDAFWAQLVTDDHLSRAPAASAQATPTANGRHLLQIGQAANWLDPPKREAQREVGRAMLDGCLVGKERARELHHSLWREWRDSQPLPQDDPPAWALPVRPPEGMTRSSGHHEISLTGPGIAQFTERFGAPDGRELTVSQRISGESRPPGNPWTEVAGVRVQEMRKSRRDSSRTVFWTERGRTLRVGVNEAAADHLEHVVLDLHRAAKASPHWPSGVGRSSDRR